MYRHFAIATVGITVCLGVFADGERRHEITEEIQEQKRANDMREEEFRMAREGKGGNKQPFAFKDNRAVKGSFGSEAGSVVTNDVGDLDLQIEEPADLGEYGAPEISAGSHQAASGTTHATAAPPGMTAGQTASLQEIEAARRKKKLKRKLTPEELARLGLAPEV